MPDDRELANPHRPVYVERVNAAIDYIEQHLDEEMTLEQIADVAHFSPFHFHRVFSLLVGETLSRFINRLRLERSATRLIQHQNRSITEVASDCGLHHPSSFSRSFRDRFGMTPSAWRAGGHINFEIQSEDRLLNDDTSVGAAMAGYGIVETRSGPEGQRRWEIACGELPAAIVEIVDIPDLEVAYVRHTGHYQGSADVFTDIFARLMNWAEARGLVNPESWLLSVYHDNPGITDDDRLRVSACLSVPAATTAEGDVGRMRLGGGQCAVARFELGDQDYGTAWFALMCGWLPDSGYEPDDRLPFERYPMEISTTSEDTQVVDIAIPVRPLRRY